VCGFVNRVRKTKFIKINFPLSKEFWQKDIFAMLN